MPVDTVPRENPLCEYVSASAFEGLLDERLGQTCIFDAAKITERA